MKLGILLTTLPLNQGTRSALKIAEAALRRGITVELFLMGDGIYNVKQGEKARSAEAISRLISQGAKVALCALNAQQRGVGEEEAIAGVLFGSQYDLALLVAEADRFLSFT